MPIPQTAVGPNRIADGRYEATSYQLPINEVARGCALHGVSAWA